MGIRLSYTYVGVAGGRRNGSRWRKSIRFTSPFYRQRILSAALCRFAFSCRECCRVPAFSSTRTIRSAAYTCTSYLKNAYFACSNTQRRRRDASRECTSRRAGTLLKLLAAFAILPATVSASSPRRVTTPCYAKVNVNQQQREKERREREKKNARPGVAKILAHPRCRCC